MGKIVSDREELLYLLKELIRINSVNPSLVEGGAGEGEISRYLGERMRRAGLEVRFQHLDRNRSNVIGLLRGKGGGKSIILNGHTDTVSAEGMAIDPFDPRIKEGRVYGRGALDMKAGLAAQLAAVETIAGAGLELKGDVILAFVADEEYASAGTEALVEEYRADAAVICEPTDLQVTIAHKGFAWIQVEVFGRAAHGSRPEEGIDAIVQAGRLLMELERLNRTRLQEKRHPLLGFPSVHASLISGGTELSTYPDYCNLKLERRTLPGEDEGSVREEIGDLLSSLAEEDPQFKADFELILYRSALELRPEEPIVKTLAAAGRRVLNREVPYVGFGGWMDSAILAAAGIPAVIFGPRGGGPHAAEEYVEIDSVVDTAQILIETLIDFCG